MNPDLDGDIRKSWHYERAQTEGTIRRLTQQAAEKAVGRGGSSYAVRQLSLALLTEFSEKAARVMANTKQIFESHGEAPTIADEIELRQRYQEFLREESADAQAAIHRENPIEPTVARLTQNELGSFRDQSDHHFKLMLVSLRTTAASKPMKSEINIHGSNVQLGDHNTQNNQVTVFRDILVKIDASQHSEAAKTEAKGKLTELLTHPVIVSTIGALAQSVFKQ